MDTLEESFSISDLVAIVLLKVCVFPKINSNDWHALHINDSMHQWVILVVGLSDEQATIGTNSEPNPSGENARDNSSFERFLKAFEIGKVLSDRLGKLQHKV